MKGSTRRPYTAGRCDSSPRLGAWMSTTTSKRPGDHALVLHFHLGPTVVAVLDGANATLEWPSRDSAQRALRRATLRLPGELRWSMHRGELDPVRGWYSPAFGVKTPSTTLVGQGVCRRGNTDLHAELEFDD